MIFLFELMPFANKAFKMTKCDINPTFFGFDYIAALLKVSFKIFVL
jgi:hypothetical protein